MKYITIYNTLDGDEITILRNLFEQEEIDFKILGETDSAGSDPESSRSIGMRVQVRENQREEAKDILIESGFLDGKKHHKGRRRKKALTNKWMLIFLAALVVVIVALLIVWFMNAN